MRFLLSLTLVLLSFGATPATGPTTRRATKPAKQRFSLMHGGVRYVLPPGWTESGRNEDEKNAQYQSPDGKGIILVGVTQQDYAFPKENHKLINTMKASILNGMRAKFKERGDELIYGPQSESDDRFIVRIHVRYKHEGETYDEMHDYRVAGIDMLMVMTQAKTDQVDEAKALQDIGDDVSLSMALGQVDRKKPSK